MKRGTGAGWRLCIALLLAATAFSGAVYGATTEAVDEQEIDAVWSTSDGRRLEIFYTQLRDGAWQEPVQVTDDYFDNHYPVVDRDSTGRRWLFWTAYDNGRMELHYTTGRDDSWERSSVLAAEMKTNTAPSVVIDGEDVVWVVWAANDGRQDDVYWARFADGAWTEPLRLHDENQAPDLLPEIDLEGDGRPRVTWQTLADDSYRHVSSRWTGEGWSEPETLDPERADDAPENTEKRLELPPFLERTGMVFVRVY